MGFEDGDWWKERQNDAEKGRLNDSLLWCKNCQGLTVNALTLICSSCKFDNSPYYVNRDLPSGHHPSICNCAKCVERRLGRGKTDKEQR